MNGVLLRVLVIRPQDDIIRVRRVIPRLEEQVAQHHLADISIQDFE
jgi:hypothetical protein